MRIASLSANAVPVVRFEVRGYRAKRGQGRLQAYHELAAGIMQPVPGRESEFRFTQDAFLQRHELLAEAEDRIEHERLGPPDANGLTAEARGAAGANRLRRAHRDQRGEQAAFPRASGWRCSSRSCE
jgi:hypothetical protein